MLPVYETLWQQLVALGARWVRLDEPVLSLDRTAEQLAFFLPAYSRLRAAAPAAKLMLATYFGDLGTNLPSVLRLPLDAIHLDAVRAPQELAAVLDALAPELALSLGVVDGRNIWRNDFTHSLSLLQQAHRSLGPDRQMVSPSCSRLHVPVSRKTETKLDAELKGWLAFAEEKLAEVVTLARLLEGQTDSGVRAENQAATESRSRRIHNPSVAVRCAAVTEADTRRANRYAERARIQAAKLRLPLLPTTTTGSFPQTEEVRAARAKFKKGECAPGQYERFLEEEIRTCVRRREELGVDVLVHGEFERNDPVEYFGEQLSGFAFTESGWVQSYGSRCVKPPLIIGDMQRPRPMTARWAKFARSLTRKPMKGMLTGPITLLQWSLSGMINPAAKRRGSLPWPSGTKCAISKPLGGSHARPEEPRRRHDRCPPVGSPPAAKASAPLMSFMKARTC